MTTKKRPSAPSRMIFNSDKPAPVRIVNADHCRQAIETRYHGPTNSRGARVSATAQAGRIYVSWDHALGTDENHAAAAKAFAERWGWGGRWVGGGRADGRGNVYTNIPSIPRSGK